MGADGECAEKKRAETTDGGCIKVIADSWLRMHVCECSSQLPPSGQGRGKVSPLTGLAESGPIKSATCRTMTSEASPSRNPALSHV